MKQLLILLVMLGLLQLKTQAQADELTQLSLNLTKLKQFKKTLQNLYNGYAIVSDGYTKIKGVTEGTYSLHQVFLDGLMIVSPGVKKYVKVAEIISLQNQLVNGYKSTLNNLKASNVFSAKEIEYMTSVYGNVVNKSLEHLEELLLVITSSRLRMSDDERISAIDRIYKDMKEKWTFLQAFNNSNNLLGVQRQRQQANDQKLQSLYDVNH